MTHSMQHTRPFLSGRWPRWGGAGAVLPALAALLPFGTQVSARPAAAQETTRTGELIPLTALVRDGASQRALAGAVIELDGVVARHVTGEEGRAELKLPAGTYTLRVHKGGYQVLVGDLRVFEPGEFTLDMDRAADVDVRVPPKLLVRVVDGDTGNGIDGATVSIPDGGSRVTNHQGRTEFTELRTGVAQVTVDMIGYARRTEPVALHPDRTTVVEVEMSPQAIELEPIVVDVRSPFLESWGVYERLDHGVPRRVLTRRMLDERALVRLSDAFFGMPGVRVTPQTLHSTRLVARGRCTLSVYVDGFRWGTDIDAVPPEWVEIAEVYWGLSTPIEFSGGGNGCGAVLIWTRHGAA